MFAHVMQGYLSLAIARRRGSEQKAEQNCDLRLPSHDSRV